MEITSVILFSLGLTLLSTESDDMASFVVTKIIGLFFMAAAVAVSKLPKLKGYRLSR